MEKRQATERHMMREEEALSTALARMEVEAVVKKLRIVKEALFAFEVYKSQSLSYRDTAADKELERGTAFSTDISICMDGIDQICNRWTSKIGLDNALWTAEDTTGHASASFPWRGALEKKNWPRKRRNGMLEVDVYLAPTEGSRVDGGEVVATGAVMTRKDCSVAEAKTTLLKWLYQTKAVDISDGTTFDVELWEEGKKLKISPTLVGSTITAVLHRKPSPPGG
eukprot:GHVU01167555.1.p1 GENE.GHVU01167555.1~~GHVU01167555.1.p1  ORF type:complete len:225 (+),score=29.86 GHVU01167555.1:375-1049(+)